jgi:hypothetical protein
VYVAEEEEHADDLSDDRWLLGTFEGHLDGGRGIAEEFRGLSAGEAIAWARARAARVLIRLGDGGYYAAGEKAGPDEPIWPPANLPPLVRRRPESERWKDRSETDPPIEWVVPLLVVPPRFPASSEDIDEAMRVAAEAAGVEPPRPLGETGYEPGEGVPFRVLARTRNEAVAIAAAQCPVPEGWTADALVYAVRPA